jgi:hypothetical protein
MFCFLGFSISLKPDPLKLIESLKEEMSSGNRQFLSALIHSEVKKNNYEIAHLREQLSVNHGGKMTSELNRKREINQKIEKLESQNETLLKNL